MKFHVAWAKIAQENAILKSSLIVLGSLCVLLAICMTRMALKDPLVIDRGCFSRTASIANAAHTNIELEAFLEEALPQRFNSKDFGREVFLSDSERDLRTKEQKDLAARKLTQKVLINAVKVEDGAITVDADRLISVGEIRSAFKFSLNVKIESIARTASNPFGLILSEVKPLEKKEKQ